MKLFCILSLLIFPVVLLTTCTNDDNRSPDQVIRISSLSFIGEQIIPDGMMFNGTVVGGLSGIDFSNGVYYIISDTSNPPLRFYTAQLTFDQNSFSSIELLSQQELLDNDAMPFVTPEADPEAIRFDPISGHVVWASEGHINSNIDPFVRLASTSGTHIDEFTTPAIFRVDTTAGQGPRHNGTFEGLCLSANEEGYWVAMELPLEQDGPVPVFGTDTTSPVRITYIDRNSGQFGEQFAYELDAVVRDGDFTINGVVDILAYAEDQFLVLERSFASGTADGGNDVRIYQVDASSATDVSSLAALAGASYTTATKNLLFDFEDIRAELSSVPGGSTKVVDNIEGLCFGPDLPNGNKSLVLVADNNFSSFGAQLNQFIVLEVIP